jgi:hypothetical protein
MYKNLLKISDFDVQEISLRFPSNFKFFEFEVRENVIFLQSSKKNSQMHRSFEQLKIS